MLCCGCSLIRPNRLKLHLIFKGKKSVFFCFININRSMLLTTLFTFFARCWKLPRFCPLVTSMDLQRSRKKGRANYYVVAQISSPEIRKELRDIQLHLESTYPTVRAELRKGFSNLENDIHLTLFALHANTARAQQVIRYLLTTTLLLSTNANFSCTKFNNIAEQLRNLNSLRKMICVSTSNWRG